MNPHDGGNSPQALFWTDVPGQKWARLHPRIDHLFSLITEELLARAAPKAGQRVLDVGCGCGDTTLRAAGLVGETGRVEGIDISDVLLAVARRRAAGHRNVTLTRGDAQTHALAEGRYDLLLSRFGLMFFSDPVAAFVNLARALRPGAPLVFATWAPAEENPWSFVPRTAGQARLGVLPPDPPRQPGQFAFAEPAYVTGILRDAGLSGVQGETVDTHLLCPGTADAAAALATSIGPVSRLMRDRNGTEDDLAAIAASVAVAFSRYEKAGSVRVPARIHFFHARKA